MFHVQVVPVYNASCGCQEYVCVRMCARVCVCQQYRSMTSAYLLYVCVDILLSPSYWIVWFVLHISFILPLLATDICN